MGRSGLKLVDGARPPQPSWRHRATAVGIAGVLAVSAFAATVVGVEAARHPIEPRDLARTALELSLEFGNNSPQVREMLLELRSSLGRRPLDSRTRVVYAALLLSLAQRMDDTRAAAHHATRAADLAPVTVPIVRLAVLTLARSGDEPLALARIRKMFDYDARSAAGLLAEIEPLVQPSAIGDGLGDDPDAWFAWAARLRTAGRFDEAYDWNARALRRWPDHLPTLRFVAARAVRANDWEALDRLLPADLGEPGQTREPGAALGAAPLLTYRARLKAARGDTSGAIEDVRRALALAGESNLVQILAGEAFAALGDYTAARRHWRRALFDVPAHETTTRRNVLTNLARLEERYGRPSEAVQLWESVLELEPAHDEATRRIRALTVFDR